ncbi:MAG: hypothetical protein FWD97_06760 [Defluviitaleaceae bacterium]|nr:hypothetical protein [Defluviitaleaceae bacterium]
MDFFNLFFQMEINQQILVGGLAGFVLLVVVLRIVLTISYQAAVGLAHMGAKNLKSKVDIEKLPNGAFGRVAKEYSAMAGAGAKVDSLRLAQLSVHTNRLLFFNFNSLGRLIKGLDTAFVPLSILVAVAVTSHRLEVALFLAGAFVVMRIIGVIFDVETARDRYTTVLSQVLAKDVGKFFPQDTAGAVYTLGADLKEFLARQSAMYSDILTKINGEFTNAIKSNVATMTDSVEATLNAITRHDGVGEAANQIKTLGVVAEAMAERIEHTSKSSEVLEQNLQTVRENQKVLEVSVATYEASLKGMTAQMGDAMGKIVAYHMSTANSQIADSIGENLAMAKSANAEQLADVKEIFAQLTEQNRQQTRILTELLKGGEGDE